MGSDRGRALLQVPSGIHSTGYLSWVVSSLTSVYALVTGRPTWLQLRRGRTSGLWVAAQALSSFLIAGVAAAYLASVSGRSGATEWVVSGQSLPQTERVTAGATPRGPELTVGV